LFWISSKSGSSVLDPSERCRILEGFPPFRVLQNTAIATGCVSSCLPWRINALTCFSDEMKRAMLVMFVVTGGSSAFPCLLALVVI